MVILHNGEYISKFVFAPVLKACSKASALKPGEQIHAQSIKFGLLSDIFVQTSLVAMYSSCGQLELALNVFDKMPQRNVVTWTTMMDSCLKSEQPELVLFFFREMQKSGVSPDDFTIVSLLTACARLGALNLGRWIHGYINRMEMELTVFIGTALIDFYCKCGSVDDALEVFKSMEKKSVRCWNAMLHGFSVHGHGEKALSLFSEMEMDSRVRPNDVTFVAVLCGCSHNGLVEEGRLYFSLMQRKYGIQPSVKHYGCMVDLLGRAGLVDEAFEMVIKMKVAPNAVVWGSLLSACRAQNNLAMAERVTRRIEEIEGDDSLGGDTSHYVIMSNMYARVGNKDRMAKARAKIGKKPKGWSSIETGGEVHRFSVGEASHPKWGKIEQMLDEVKTKIGQDFEMEDFHNLHSEKVAVAYGLLSTTWPAPIKIVKNLRICEDCHQLMKLISLLYDREIVIRDCTRFHRFMEGYCSCKDYW
ncbi:Pentatricopeptide repeat [Thalictrum thalictroides]|uniref:Pentatricopeptide repeat n=1 Tax=Thalictrum thalictroides TaxID=46969 RepID=A0A7J6WAT3_THATH|nr:Pentatricopeptide repeat [Thalictrum thalictroides]